MYIGILTAPFGDSTLEQVCKFAGKAGFTGLEIHVGKGSKVLDPWNCKPQAVRALLKKYNLKVSSLAHYGNVLHPDPEVAKGTIATLKKAIDLAPELGTDVVCTLAGLPHGKGKHETIEEDLPGIFKPLARQARKQKVKIAFENWTATNIQDLSHWRLLFQVIPDDNVGLNYDPSHLYWQQIDYIAAAVEFAPRIFHTHAKDTEIRHDILRNVGVHGRGWWRYVIPGCGEIQWGKYLNTLRRNGYSGAVSIEHEDGAFTREGGFLAAQKFLSVYI